jgi:hypothetical protein
MRELRLSKMCECYKSGKMMSYEEMCPRGIENKVDSSYMTVGGFV